MAENSTLLDPTITAYIQDLAGIPLQLDINLERLTMTTLIGYLYANSEVIQILKDIYLEAKLSGFKTKFDAENNEAVKLVMRNLNSLNLPYKFMGTLSDLTILFSARVFSWIKHLDLEKQLDLRYTDQIYWKSYGFIDEEKIFQMYWSKDNDFCQMKIPIGNCRESVSALYLYACIYVQEDLIQQLKSEIVEEIKTILPVFEIPNEVKSSDIIAIYLGYCFGEKFDEHAHTHFHEELLSKGSISLKDALRISAYFSFTKCFKYFWELVDKKDKKEMLFRIVSIDPNLEYITKIPSDCLNGLISHYSNDWIEKSRCVQTLLFILNQMTRLGIDLYLRRNIDTTFILFLTVWPFEIIYENFCIFMEFFLFTSGIAKSSVLKKQPMRYQEIDCELFLFEETRRRIIQLLGGDYEEEKALEIKEQAELAAAVANLSKVLRLD